MLRSNKTPFAAIAFEQVHRDGRNMAVVTARGRFSLDRDGGLQLSETQGLVLADGYEGDPFATPLVEVSDLVPFKPFADVTVRGSAYAPGGFAAASWTCAIGVGERRCSLLANSPRVWRRDTETAQPEWRLWPSGPRRFSTPIDYRATVGGLVLGDPERTRDPFNPIGVGVRDPKFTPPDGERPAANIEGLQNDTRIQFERPDIAGFGPISPWWSWRAKHLGTRDDAWRNDRFPRVPEDFSYRFFNVAHPALIQPSFLQGDESFDLVGLAFGCDAVKFRLPERALVADFVFVDDRRPRARLNLDGVHFDLRGEPPWRIQITWRAWIEICPRFWYIELSDCCLSDALDLPSSDEDGLTED